MFNFDVVLPQFKQALTYESRTEGRYEDDGTFTRGDLTVINFTGTVLPLSDHELKYMPDGDYSKISQKLYTDIDFTNGTFVTDSSNQRYKVHKFREYNIVNPTFHRYFLEREARISD